MVLHLLANLTVDQINEARQVILDKDVAVVVDFREIFLQELCKANLLVFLAK